MHEAEPIHKVFNHSKEGKDTYFQVEVRPRKLGPGERGIICCPVQSRTKMDAKSGAVSHEIKRRIDPHELRFAALFWDVIDAPTGMLRGSSPDLEYLEGAGIVQRSHITHHDPKGGEGVFVIEEIAALDPIAAMMANNEISPGLWSVQHGIENESAGLPRVVNSTAVVFNLHSVIPIPDKDVPLAELLEFKLKRSSELKALQAHLSELYLQVCSSPMPALAESVVLTKLQLAINDHIRVSRESSMALRLIGFKAKIDRSTVGSGAAAFATAASLHLAPALQFLAGITGGVLGSLSKDVGTGNPRDTLNPYEYVTLIHRDLFV
jgi:hypothetical protein